MTMLPIHPSELRNPTPREFRELRQRLFYPPTAREPPPAALPIRSAHVAATVSPPRAPLSALPSRLDALMAQFRIVVAPQEPQPALPIKPRCILYEVGAKHGFTASVIQSRGQTKPVVLARQEAAYRMFMECRWMSYPSIGMALGGRDHTTAMHSVRSHARRHGLPCVRT